MAVEQNIPGVPLGARIVRIGAVNDGDWWLRGNGTIGEWAGPESPRSNYVILAPDNVYGVCDLGSVKHTMVEHYELLSPLEFRTPRDEEPFVDQYRASDGLFLVSRGGSHYGDTRRLICRRKAPKTQRVLVLEYVEPTDQLVEFFTLGNVTSSRAKSVSGRVEERPIQ